MLLGNLLKHKNKNYQKIQVKGISFDSRKVKKEDIFFAIKGKKTSGVKFIKDAISKGACAIVVNKDLKYKNDKIAIISVRDVRSSLAEAASNFFIKKPKNIIAVTGTNGKSSVADFFCQILNFNKIAVASIGTLGVISKKYKKKINLTSLDPLSLHKNLEILSKKKINNVILEASSHGLHQKRLNNLSIKVGIFTNLSHDHLDYHKNIKSYFNSKMHLFKNLLNKKSTIITDEENKEFKSIEKIAMKKRIVKKTIGSKNGDIKILHNLYNKNNQVIKIFYKKNFYTLKIPLIGYFQIKNLLMAVLAAVSCGLKPSKILNQISKIRPVPGRLECVAKLNNNSNIIIDFAHTPDALEQTLIALKKQFKKKIIIVFGCGGERDKSKRLLMGKIAGKYCRKIFVTDDNPRNESPSKIRSAVIKGCKSSSINIGNRKKAIELAIKELKLNEILLVAGKGHEEKQDYGSKIINFSDKKIIKKILSNKNLISKEMINKIEFQNLNYSGVAIDTRNIKKNNLFFALKGKKSDGHKFVKEAIKQGAAKCIISKKIKRFPRNKIIKVKDTFSSLNRLAKIKRDQTSAKIIGITGSSGKTTLKNLVGFALKNYGKVYHSPHSYNNKYGVPLSLSHLKKNTDYGVFEIGMDKAGEIDSLSKIVKPEIGIITNISGAHFKNFKTLKDIAKAKSEIIDHILEEGNIILNKDDSFFNFLSNKAKKKRVNVISFSAQKNADIYLLEVKKVKNFYRLKIIVKKSIFYFNIKFFNKTFINNILACISTLFILNLDLNKMKDIFINFTIPRGRGDINLIKRFKKNFKFIDESYNANPLSMALAIKNMDYHKCKKNSQKIIFLGDMLELGDKSKKFHKELSTVINRSNVDKVFVYGKYIRETFKYLNVNKKGKVFNNLKDAHAYFAKNIHNNDLLMVKGSNATGLKQFSENIKKGQISVI